MEDEKEDPVALAAKLPLSDKVVHKNWKVREAAYKELTKKFDVAPEDDKVYASFAGSLVKIAKDANAPAQLSGFDTVSKFAETAPPALVRRLAADIGKAIAEKGMNGRPVNKKRATAALIMFVGADCGDVVIQSFAATGIKSRTPKVVAATADTIREALVTYGSAAVPVKVVMTHVPTLFAHSSEQVRNAGKELTVELHLWTGERVRGVLKGAKEVIVKELEALFVKNASREKPKPKELTRAKKNRVRDGGGGESDEDGGAEGFGVMVEEEEEEVEEIDLMQKLQGLKIEFNETEETKVKKDWFGAVDSKKWNGRKQALDTAVDIVGNLRITPGPHAELISRLRKILAKDSNINVVASAAKLIRAMANGMRKDFPGGPAKALAVDLLVRLKEKNKIVIDAVSSALDMLHLKKSIRVVEMRDELTAAAGKKSPKARVELFKWLARCLKKGIAPGDMKGPVLKSFGNLFLKGAEDSSGDVRDAALSAISALQVVAGDRNVMQFLDKLDQKRKSKVEAGVKLIIAERKAEGVEQPEPKKVSKAGKKPQGGKKIIADGTSAESSGKSKSSKSAPKRKPKPVVYVSDDEGETSISSDVALQETAKLFPDFDTEAWSVKSAKARAACMKSLNEVVKAKGDLEEESVNTLLALLVLEPGLRDTSFMVVKEKLEMLGTLSEKCVKPMPRKTLRALLIPAIEKLGDMKCAMVAARVLMFSAEATSARFFFEVLSQVAQETSNGRAKVGIVKFASKVIDDFGIPAVKPELVAPLVVAMSMNAAPALLKACVTLACQTSVRSSASFKDMLVSAGLASETVEAFDAELTKYQTAPDPPCRKRRQFPGMIGQSSTKEETDKNVVVDVPETQSSKDEIKGKESSPDMKEFQSPGHFQKQKSPANSKESVQVRDHGAPVAPVRVSIAEHFAPGSQVVKNMKSSNWNTRLDALHEVDAIIKDSNSFIDPNVGTEIVPIIKFRLTDSNRNIAAVAHGVAGRFMKAMGPGAVVHLRILIPTILAQGCVDIKKNVRAAAMQNLESWFETVGLSPLIPYLHRPLATLNSNFRKEYLEWLAPRLSGDIGTFSAKDEDLTPLLDSCLACLRDRVAEVRHLAEVIFVPVLASVELPAVESKLSSMTKTARMHLEPILARHASGEGGQVARELPKTPRAPGRARPHSVALPSPRTPHRRRLGDPTTGQLSSGRRRPVSTRVGPASSPFASSKGGQTLIPNDQRSARAQRYMEKRKRVAERAAELDGDMSGSFSAEDPEDLAADLRECVSPLLFEKLTAAANRYKLHVEAMTSIKTCMSDSPESMVSVSDVILRWTACRIEDSRTPPTVLSKIAEFISNICEVLLSSGFKLSEYEASALIPAVVGKVGSNRDSVRESMLAALLSIGDVVPEDIMLIFLSECLRRPIGDRSCQEVAAEICQLIDRKCGSGAGLPVGVLPVICTVTYGADENAGRAAASCIAKAHQYFGDDTWGLLGKLTDEQALLIEQRLALANAAQTVEHGAPLGTPRASPRSSPGNQNPGFVGQSPKVPHLSDIRTEDFRLSVAPEPPSSVLSSIKGVLDSHTPARSRPAFGRAGVVPPTPALPQGNTSPFSPDIPESIEIMAYVLKQFESEDPSAQQDGLAALYNDLQQKDSKLRNETSTIMPNLSRCFSAALFRLEQSQGNGDDPLILKRFLNALMAFAREPDVIVRLDQQGMERVLNDLLNAMVPEKVQKVEDWTQVRRGVNLVTIKILEACDQNLLFSALINVLRTGIKESAAAHGPSFKGRISAKCTFCIKSIAKATQKGFSNCNIDALLRDMHDFLISNPVLPHKSEVTEEQTIAIRLLKTIVDSMILEIGVDIRKCLRLVPNVQTSQLARYIEMKLTDGSIALPMSKSPEQKNSSSSSRAAEINASPSRVSPARAAHGSGQVYLKRLQEIQQRYGLQSPSDGTGSAPGTPSRDASTSPREKEVQQVSKGESPKKENDNVKVSNEDTRNKALALRNRMARLRESRSQPAP